MSWDEERQPLLPQADYSHDDVHDQFCQLVGVPPSDLASGKRWKPAERSLYERAIRLRSRQSCTYSMTASIANILLLSQVIIGAAVTGIGASKYSPVAITLLGAANTIIAGLVAYLKSRGQPMRARMFRDDLERVVDEIENSEIMWLGISKNVNGYDDIDTEDQVTVRSEVARLTRLYDKAVRNNTLNNPDLYGSGEGGISSAALRNRNLPGGAAAVVPALPPGPASAPPAATAGSGNGGGEAAAAPAPAPEEPAPLAADPDESPATAKPTAPTAVKVVVGDDAVKNDGDAVKKDDDNAKMEDSTAKKDGKVSKEDSMQAGKASDAKDTKSDASTPVADGAGAGPATNSSSGQGKNDDADDAGEHNGQAANVQPSS